MIFFFIDLYIIFFIISILVYSLYEKKVEIDFYSDESVKFYIFLAIVGLLSVGFFMLSMWSTFKFSDNNVVSMGCYNVSNLIVYSKCLIIIIVSLFLILSFDFLKHEKLFIEFIILIMFIVLGFFIFMSANEFIFLFLGLELQSICFYIVFSLFSKNNVSFEASLKYYILSIFSSAVLVLGISFLYLACGTTKFLEIGVLSYGQVFYLYNLGFLFFLIGIFFKLAIVPFHYWVSDLYAGLPIFVVFLYAGLSKIPYIVFLITFIKIVHIPALFFDLLYYLSILSILYGSLAGLYQRNFMRILALGSINHVGFIMLGLSLGSIDGIISSLNYLIVYIFLTVGLFSSLLSIKVKGLNSSEAKILDIIKFFKISKFNFVFSVIFASFILSFAGVPPFAGFFAKFGIISLLIDSNYFFTFMLVSFCSILSAVFYVRLIRFLFFSNLSDRFTYTMVKVSFNTIVYWVISICLFLNLFYFIIYPYLFSFFFV